MNPIESCVGPCDDVSVHLGQASYARIGQTLVEVVTREHAFAPAAEAAACREPHRPPRVLVDLTNGVAAKAVLPRVSCRAAIGKAHGARSRCGEPIVAPAIEKYAAITEIAYRRREVIAVGCACFHSIDLSGKRDDPHNPGSVLECGRD